MFITLHCGGMPFDASDFNRKSLGGSESAAYYIANDLARQGHRVTLFTNSRRETRARGVNYQWAGNLTDDTPLGDRFTFYAENTPMDILVIQRHPHAWRHDWMAKVRLWWLHDLAMPDNKTLANATMWNCDGILCVSDYHKAQVAETYGIDPDFIHVMRNGVDLSLYEDEKNPKIKTYRDAAPTGQFRMMYSSRPERGLEHLVRPGGIMERLAESVPDAMLYVCMYDNHPPHMKDYYEYLERRCRDLPNVQDMGSLGKRELAACMLSADLQIYPTSFKEVSCITVMEACAACLPVVTTDAGALPETMEGMGVATVPLQEGRVDEDGFVAFVESVAGVSEEGPGESVLDRLSAAQYAARQRTRWEGRSGTIVSAFFAIRRQVSKGAIAQHLMAMSDIGVLVKFLEDNTKDVSPLILKARLELGECYQFYTLSSWKDHYDLYYQHEAEKGVNYGPEDPSGQSRYEFVLEKVKELPEGARILDYGCAHGHFTNNLAKQCPDKTFIGVDIAESNVQKARDWAPDNATFVTASIRDKRIVPEQEGVDFKASKFDFIIAAEVIEHVKDAVGTVDTLCRYLTPTGYFLATTPYGPWESMGYRKEHPWRAHVHHLERQDLHAMFGHHDYFKIIVAPYNAGSKGKGSYIWTFRKPHERSRRGTYNRKIMETIPRQTLSVCIIAKDEAPTIRRTLLNLRDVADEIVIGIDKQTTDNTEDIVKYFTHESHRYPLVKTISIESPTVTGFDEARNRTIEAACGDWILWMDCDEIISYPERIEKYLRHNQYVGYAVKQHHLSCEPAGVMKTDIPVRLFRNHRGIRFFGRVHEHPEVDINKGVGRVSMASDVEIMHTGYTNEQTRRKRFWRNLPLMVRDREDYPDRILGKFLWLRDLCQMCQYELESNGGKMTQGIADRITEGVQLFEALLDYGEVRYVVEGLPFYSPLVRLTGKGFDASFHVGRDTEKVTPHHARFLNREHFGKVMGLLQDSVIPRGAENEVARYL